MIKEINENVGFYVRLSRDDGYSGLSFDRLQMNRLLNNVKQGKVNVAIAKDLRIGQNQTKFSEIVDEFCHFITVHL